jgi:hypothetical protein
MMIRLDPMIKLAIIVAIGVTITMLLGVGQPNEQSKLAVINKSQTPLGQLPAALKTGNALPMEQFLIRLENDFAAENN